MAGSQYPRPPPLYPKSASIGANRAPINNEATPPSCCDYITRAGESNVEGWKGEGERGRHARGTNDDAARLSAGVRGREGGGLEGDGFRWIGKTRGSLR